MQLRELEPFEHQLRRDSLVGDHRFFDVARFPWISALEARAHAIAREYKRCVEGLLPELPSFQDIQREQSMLTQDARWKMLLLRGYNEPFERTARRFPITIEALAAIPGCITAFFSVLCAGKRIPLHNGPHAGVLRCHLPLIVPADRERCWIEVGGERHCWEEHRAVVFDDCYPHHVANLTHELRMVLFLDVLRPLPPRSHAHNLEHIASIQGSPFVQEAKARYLAWEQRAFT